MKVRILVEIAMSVRIHLKFVGSPKRSPLKMVVRALKRS